MYSKYLKTRMEKFEKLYGAGVMKAIYKTGLFYPAVMGQSAYESDYGEKIPVNSNNFGGIKYNPKLKDVIGFVDSITTENENGRLVKKVQRFAKFKDVESGFKAHIEVLMGDRYKNARLNAKSPEEQILMIVKSGYSTLPPQTYLGRMKGIIEASRDISKLGRIG